MRTTLKRALRADAGDVRYYRAPAPKRPSLLRRCLRVLLVLVLAALALALGAAGGVALWLDRSVQQLQAHTPAVKRAEKQLVQPKAGKPATALLLGVDKRLQTADRNTDTMMLVRADPRTKTISLLSIPRDLDVSLYCPGRPVTSGRINSAYERCGPKGVLDTIRHLTGLSVNYLALVDFRGFQQIVDRLGGIWMDVDRRYYNRNIGTPETNYANIDLQPGYQKLTGAEALAYVRYRHTDSDLYRLAREQAFVQAVKDQIARHFQPLKLPGLVNAITSNVEIGSKQGLSDRTMLGYAFFAAQLPPGHVVQTALTNVSEVVIGGADELAATPDAIRQAVRSFLHPRVVGAAKPARASKHARPPRPAARRPAAAVPAGVVADAATGAQLLRPFEPKAPFTLETPTVLPEGSTPSWGYASAPARVYEIASGHKAVRLVFGLPSGEYWGIEETDWSAAPILADRNTQIVRGGRTYTFYYHGSRLHMVVLHDRGATYWVVNTLLDGLSNQTMRAVAFGLRPLGV